MPAMLKSFTPGSLLILAAAAIVLTSETAAAQGKANITVVKFKSAPVAATVPQDLMVTSQGQCGQIKIDFGDGTTFNIPSTVGRPLPGGSFVYSTPHTYAKSGTVTVTATGTSACSGKASVVVAVGAAPPPPPGSRSATPGEASRTMSRDQQGAGKVPAQSATAAPAGGVTIEMPKVPSAVPPLTARMPKQGATLNEQVEALSFLSVQDGGTKIMGHPKTGDVTLPWSVQGARLFFEYKVVALPAAVIDKLTQPHNFDFLTCCVGFNFALGGSYYELPDLTITKLSPEVLMISVGFPAVPSGSETVVELSVVDQGNIYRAEPVEIQWGAHP